MERVLGELSLDEHADTAIGSLSGGQRKRTGVATELLNRPSVLFLDEPTTGMDPGLETQMMKLFQALSRGGRAVAVVTHATKNLALCDRVIVMGRGGVLTYDGPPAGAAEFFGVEDYDGIYTALAETPAAEWQARFESEQRPREAEAPSRDAAARAGAAAGSAPAPIADSRVAIPEAVHARPPQPRAAASARRRSSACSAWRCFAAASSARRGAPTTP